MKLVRFGEFGREKPGLIDSDGKVRDLSGIIADLNGETLAPESLKKIAGVDPASLPLAPEGARLGACVARPGNFVAVGLNFADHAAETNNPIPEEPVLFNKAPNCIVGPNDDVMIPKGSLKLDWEVEFAFVIGKRARYVEEKDALDYVAGYCICNDVSERHFQIERSGQWMKGKGCETFGPLGPWLVTTDEIPDTSTLAMWLEVNGERVQNGSMKTMIFRIPFLVHYISQFMVLDPGDVITTGTPPGVGLGFKPPRFLKAGDVMRVGIEGLGEQQQTVVPFKL
ncbi:MULTISPECIES: fumarylacetoacetate hydrolase family protein [Xanthobacter]|uniref:2-keto-4-pentenoate hydratase/2-oxohepta-3-ene-1,7-dioic acid hydratase in catechol pathway n=1 Tax=Xanthobacter flavus TaxID=281 RepID=A0A9W6CH62_XANFL|nr:MULTISPECIES: fumarylacetoacetate hydrolase family protein [Xanthobacter]MDR6331874.1 2-keto-4-pentenoate hydratase/2-oxohepta-3-ene-1,7-dioic acid hydratase in catechol pathway [Xanthobacter flavus]UJX45488.1 FAA hydrolase family protein [Xanthobacter sp. YC-JY1]GLI22333.1 ureidoglycolate lyase [Xanthobacter flavus]